MANFSTLEHKHFETRSNVEKARLWQKVTDECADMDVDDIINICDARRRPCHLPFLPPPGSRGGVSSTNTSRCSSRASSRCSSVHRVCDSSAGSMLSSPAASTGRRWARPGKTRGAVSCASTDLPPASHQSKMLPRDAVHGVHGDDDEAPQVEKIEVHPKKPSAPPTELQVLPPLVSTAWQDPAEVGKLLQMAERERCTFAPTDSRPASALSHVDDEIFGSLGTRLDTSGFDHLPKELRDPSEDKGLFQASGPLIPTPPASTRENVERPTGRRKLLPPLSLDVAEAAANAALSELTRSALSGHARDTAAPPSVKEAWSAPQQPQGPPSANRFTRPAFRQRPGWNADAETPSEASNSHTKLSL